MSDLVSKCVLRVEVNDDKDEGDYIADIFDIDLIPIFPFVENNGNEPTRKDKKGKGSKNRRNVKDISVETFPSVLESPREDWGLLPASSRERLTSGSFGDFENRNEIGFFSGNPFVEITKGVLHLYKEEYVCFIVMYLF